MVDEPRHLAIPPWKCADHWSQMVTAFNRISARRRVRLHPTRMLALEIGQKLEAVNGFIDMLCNVTCVCCNDICCKKATVWYDFRDLLYLHLSLGIMPAEQIDKKKDRSCCNLTPAGCKLPRTQRPFICTWYLCPSQARLLPEIVEKENNKGVLKMIGEIQVLRRQLEDSFIAAVW